jgi:type 1 glutamine amidotransferase
MNKVACKAVVGVIAILAASGCQTSSPVSHEAQPIKALIITGGCCHDYDTQAQLLIDGIRKYANVEFDVIQEGEGTEHVHSIFKQENWTRNYDVVIHNECSANVGDEVGSAVANEIFQSGTGAVMIHCAFHTFRAMEGDEWRAALGATTKRHTHQKPITITFDEPTHPILAGTKEFVTGDEELYVIDKVFDHALPLATGHQGEHVYPLMFANYYGDAKVFSVTVGHNTATFEIDEWMHIVAKGLLWSCDKINEDGTAKDGYAPQMKKM